MLTVVIPTKNHCSYLEPLITQVLFASGSPVAKLLICNDGSTDDTAAILDEFADDERIRVFHNETSIGAMRSAVLMYQYVETPYVMFMASDDYFFPEQMSRLLADMVRNDAYVGFGKYVIEEESGQRTPLNHPGWYARRQPGADEFCALLGFDHYTSFIVTIFKCDRLPSYGNAHCPWDLQLDDMAKVDGLGEFRAHDWHLALDMAALYPDRFYFLDEFCGCFRKVATQLSSDDKYLHTGRAAYEMAMLLLKYLPDYKMRVRVKQSKHFHDAIRSLFYTKAGQATEAARQSKNFIELYKPVLMAADALLANM